MQIQKQCLTSLLLNVLFILSPSKMFRNLHNKGLIDRGVEL